MKINFMILILALLLVLPNISALNAVNSSQTMNLTEADKKGDFLCGINGYSYVGSECGFEFYVIQTTFNGTLDMNPESYSNDFSGKFMYIPNTGFVGVDYFIYNYTNGTDWSNEAWVIFGVNNTAPVAVQDNYILINSSIEGNITNNDYDLENDSLFISNTNVHNGTLILQSDGNFNYTANKTNGVDFFKYNLTDLHLTSETVYVIFVIGNNTAPIAVADQYEVALNGNVSGNILANDTDAENDVKFAYLTKNVNNGTLTLNENGTFEYISNSNFSGIDYFTYLVSDLDKNSTEVNVTLYVNTTIPVISTPTTTTSGGGGSSGGGSGGNASSCVAEWTCAEWGECIDGVQERTCVRVSNVTCFVNMEQPILSRSCTIIDFDNQTENQSGNQTFVSTITGAVIGAGQNPWFWLLVFLIIVGIVAWIVIAKNKSAKKK